METRFVYLLLILILVPSFVSSQNADCVTNGYLGNFLCKEVDDVNFDNAVNVNINHINQTKNITNTYYATSDGDYLYDNGTVIYFNETKLNETIYYNSSTNGVYVGMYLHNESGVSVNFAVQNKWYNFTNVNCGLLNGFTCNATTGTLTALYDGIYKVNAMGNGDDGNNQIFEMGVAVNNVIQNNTITSDETAAGLRTSMNSFGRIELKVGDKVNLQLRDMTSSTTGTLYNVNILIDRSGNS